MFAVSVFFLFPPTQLKRRTCLKMIKMLNIITRHSFITVLIANAACKPLALISHMLT